MLLPKEHFWSLSDPDRDDDDGIISEYILTRSIPSKSPAAAADS